MYVSILVVLFGWQKLSLHFITLFSHNGTWNQRDKLNTFLSIKERPALKLCTETYYASVMLQNVPRHIGYLLFLLSVVCSEAMYWATRTCTVTQAPAGGNGPRLQPVPALSASHSVCVSGFHLWCYLFPLNYNLCCQILFCYIKFTILAVLYSIIVSLIWSYHTLTVRKEE